MIARYLISANPDPVAIYVGPNFARVAGWPHNLKLAGHHPFGGIMRLLEWFKPWLDDRPTGVGILKDLFSAGLFGLDCGGCSHSIVSVIDMQLLSMIIAMVNAVDITNCYSCGKAANHVSVNGL